MAISDLSPTAAQKGPTCEVCRELARLDREDANEAKALRAHLANPRWRFTELSDALFADSKGQIRATPCALSPAAFFTGWACWAEAGTSEAVTELRGRGP